MSVTSHFDQVIQAYRYRLRAYTLSQFAARDLIQDPELEADQTVQYSVMAGAATSCD